MNKPGIISLVFVLIIVGCGSQKSHNEPVTAPSFDWVMDRADVISLTAEDSIRNLAVGLEKNVGSQIAVLTVETLNGENINDFSLRTANEMKIGRKDYNDGVLMTFAMKERAMRIEVGTGLEKILKDEIAMSIIADVIAPKFQEQKYGQGIYDGVQRVREMIEENNELVGKK
jgi:uncharacterized membrane protein YgcG